MIYALPSSYAMADRTNPSAVRTGRRTATMVARQIVVEATRQIAARVIRMPAINQIVRSVEARLHHVSRCICLSQSLCTVPQTCMVSCPSASPDLAIAPSVLGKSLELQTEWVSLSPFDRGA